jgi:hypothetical protein
VGKLYPSGDGTRKSYKRVPVAAIDGTVADSVEFPKCEEDWGWVKCVPLLDCGRVVGVRDLQFDSCEMT